MGVDKRPRDDGVVPQARRRNGRGSRRMGPKPPPPCPSSFKCHQCEQNHWTRDCPRVLRDPHRYPKIDVKRGCYQCGQLGHNSASCPVKREKCHECGGMHNTLHCPYKVPPQEWHEFYNSNEQHVYYVNSGTQQVTWDSPLSPLDTVLWHCDQCRLLLPDEVKECVECHVPRPVTVLVEVDDDDDSDEEEECGGEDDDELSVNGSGGSSSAEEEKTSS